MLRFVLLLSALASSAVCVSTGGVREEALRQPLPNHGTRTPAEVELYTQRPERPFVEVARLTATPGSSVRGALTDALRAHAAERGCDAVILGHDYETSSYDALLKVTDYKVHRVGTCIQFRPVETTAASVERTLSPWREVGEKP